MGRSVYLSSALWKNGGSDPDAVYHHRSDGSRDEAGIGVWGSFCRKGYFLGANMGHAIVTNRDFTAYVCDSAATRPSFQITLGKLLIITQTFERMKAIFDTLLRLKTAGISGFNPLKPIVIVWLHFECSAPYRPNLQPFLISDIRSSGAQG